ncbi:MAG: hypothetical protein J5953_13650 [Prevotella sp.]|nr:hypothetical protein [Prevotella sp.]
MKLTDSYFEARREAIKWLNVAPAKRNYTQGVLILQKSGYKPQVAALLVRQGEKGWTREKLMYCMREMLQVYYTPDDPRFNDEDVDVLNEQAGESNIREHQVDVKDVEQQGPSFHKWPKPIQRLMRAYAMAFRQREKANRERAALPDTNDEKVIAMRKVYSDIMEQATGRLEKFWALRTRYDEQNIEPTDEEIKAIIDGDSDTDDGDSESDKSSEGEDLTQMDTETLRIRRKSLVTGRTRKENMLKYQTSSRQRRENPMPECPKRMKLERQIEKLTERISKYDYELAKRS